MEEFSDLMFRWLRMSKISAREHLEAASYYERMHRQIGIQTVTLSLAAAMLYLSLDYFRFSSSLSVVFKFLPALLSVLVSVFATLHTFMGYERKAKDHQIIASQFSSIERLIEAYLAKPKNEVDEGSAVFTKNILNKLDSISEVTPQIPSVVSRRIKRQFDVGGYNSYYDSNDSYSNRGNSNE